MNPEIYHERSNESPKLPKRVQKLPNLSEMTPESFCLTFRGHLTNQGARVKSYRRSSPEIDLKIQSQTESADGRAEREFYSRGARG